MILAALSASLDGQELPVSKRVLAAPKRPFSYALTPWERRRCNRRPPTLRRLRLALTELGYRERPGRGALDFDLTIHVEDELATLLQKLAGQFSLGFTTRKHRCRIWRFATGCTRLQQGPAHP